MFTKSNPNSNNFKQLKYLPFTNALRCACSNELQSSSSLCSSNGSKFILNDPEKSTASWGIIVNFDLNVWRPISAMLTPSITILPLAASIILQFKNFY